MAREYRAFFTHGKHQDPARQKEKLLDCATCHLADARGPVALPSKGIQSEGTFNKIKADTFRTIPGGLEADAHASCAKCHWQEIKAAAAKKNGYATRAVDDAFFYVVTYTDSPTIYPWSEGVDLPFAQE
jgi:hypothetical protein